MLNKKNCPGESVEPACTEVACRRPKGLVVIVTKGLVGLIVVLLIVVRTSGGPQPTDGPLRGVVLKGSVCIGVLTNYAVRRVGLA